MRTVLHVGMSKAGSTALQDCLMRSRDALTARGVLYPENAEGVKFNNHRLLNQPLVPFAKLRSDVRRNIHNPEELAAKYDSFVSTVISQARQASPSLLILSHEGLFRRYTSDQQTRLVKELSRIGAGSVDVSVYIRRPSERYLSQLQQALRMGRELLQPGKVDYRGPLSSFAEMFGREALHPRIFDRSQLLGGSITNDFAETFLSAQGLAPEELTPPRYTNESVSAASMLLLDRFRIELSAGRPLAFSQSELLRLLIRSESSLNLPRPKLRPEISDSIDYCTMEPLWLRDAWGLEFRNFDYARLEVGQTRPVGRTYTLPDLVETPSQDGNIEQLAHALAHRFPGSPVADWALQVSRTTLE